MLHFLGWPSAVARATRREGVTVSDINTNTNTNTNSSQQITSHIYRVIIRHKTTIQDSTIHWFSYTSDTFSMRFDTIYSVGFEIYCVLVNTNCLQGENNVPDKWKLQGAITTFSSQFGTALAVDRTPGRTRQGFEHAHAQKRTLALSNLGVWNVGARWKVKPIGCLFEHFAVSSVIKIPSAILECWAQGQTDRQTEKQAGGQRDGQTAGQGWKTKRYQ